MSQPPSPFDEFYAVRVKRPENGAKLSSRDVYLTESGSFGPISRSAMFDSIESAEQAIALRTDRDQYDFSVEFCTRERKSDETDEETTFLRGLMAIPYPYRRTAYNWVRGRDVREILLRDSEEVYERHRQHLLDFDIDITQPSAIVIMRPKRRRLKVNDEIEKYKDGPKAYFVSRAERPSGGGPNRDKDDKDS